MIKRKFKYCVMSLVTVAALSITTSVLAQEAKAFKTQQTVQTNRSGLWSFGIRPMQLDTNGDGGVSQNEIDTNRAAQTATADISGDGKLSLEEFVSIFPRRNAQRLAGFFAWADVDNDKTLSTAEMDLIFSQAVMRRDKNGDGVLNRSDWAFEQDA